jgi:hypothetical protein
LLLLIASPSGALAQLSGTYRTAPGTTATYEYHGNGLQTVTLPADVTATFSAGTPTSMLTATVHKPIIGVDENGKSLYPIGDLFPMVVHATSSNGRDFDGNLLITQYLFQWEFEPTAGGELLWNGTVFWAGGRYEATTITGARLLPVNARLPGDFNRDHSVNAADYAVWRDTLDQTGNNLDADGNGSGAVDGGDYQLWRTHFGATLGSGAASSANVPEPTTWVVFIVGMILVLRGGARSVNSKPQPLVHR